MQPAAAIEDQQPLTARAPELVHFALGSGVEETPHTPPKVRLGIHNLLEKLNAEKSATVGVVPDV